jgi:ABC-2 type transport system permease protein
MRTLAVIRTELVKNLRRPRTYVAYGILVLIPVIMAVAIHLNPPSVPDREGGGGFLFLSFLSGLLLPAFALRITSALILVIVVALFGGDAIAGEANWGNLRYLLMRPIGRGRLVFSKFVVAVFCAWIAVLLVALTALIAGVITFGAEPLTLTFGDFVTAQSTSAILGHLAVATVFVAWNLTGVVAFCFMVSCMTDAPFGAIFAGVGLYFTSLILDQITSLGSIRYVLPTHYFDSWFDLVSRGQWSADMWRGALLQLAYIAVFFLIGLWWFKRKDIKS